MLRRLDWRVRIALLATYVSFGSGPAAVASAIKGFPPLLMVSARGIAPACVLSLVEISTVLGRLNTVDVERHYDTERYHLKGIGM